MSKISKFSKSYKNIFLIKDDFYQNNSLNLKSQISINNKYKKNPRRKLCKNCNKKSLHKFIESFSIEYLVCSNCSQLNGKYDDTKKFAQQLYAMRRGGGYARNYLKDYPSRVKNIYVPKVNFLKSGVADRNPFLESGIQILFKRL